tara:strand:- start:1060 stop:2208 length:1149 start_codon:yes stop_codon:yes gene_type:complete
MAWTNKVANIIKGKIGTMVASHIASKLSYASQGQTTKVAAKLLNKSPLEIGTTGPMSHMEPMNNPYNYGTVYYPNETSNLGAGHYVIFDIVSHKASKFKDSTVNSQGSLTSTGTAADGSRAKVANIKRFGIPAYKKLRSTSSGLMSTKSDTHNYISDSIILYTPAESMKFGYAAAYEDTPTGLAGDLGQAIGSVMNESGFMDKLKTAGTKGGQLVGEVMKSAAFGAAGIIPGFENSRAVLDKALGQAKNQNLEMVFQSVPFRSFSFPFVFAPKDEKEKDMVHKILQLFRFHMLPEQSNGIQGGYFTTPSEFQISYMYRENENAYLPRISRCVLKECNIDYAPEGVVSSLIPDERGAPPTIIKMDLTFGETEIMTKHTVAEGF